MERHIQELNSSRRILDKIDKSNFKRVYIFSGKHLFIGGISPEENMIKYNIQ